MNGGHLEKKAAAFFYKLAADGGNKEALFKFCDVLEDPNEYTYSRAIEFCQTHRKAKKYALYFHLL